MQYCEKCFNLMDEEDEAEGECPYCGNTRLREVRDHDYCYLISKDDIWKDVIEEIFDKYHIPYESTNDKRDKPKTYLIKEIVTYDYYVQYQYYHYAKKVLDDIINVGSYIRSMN